jgi:hypothetical protein
MGGRISESVWQALVGYHPELNSLHNQTYQTREERVVAVQRALSILRSSNNLPLFVCDFAVGYLASRIGPGSLDHADLLASEWPQDPAPIVWLGLCAGLYPDSTVQAYANGLGKRVLRNVCAPEGILERPRCDISLSELEVLFFGDNPSVDFLTHSQTYLSVELWPRVIATLRWPTQAPAPQRADLQDSRITTELRNAITGLRDLYNSLAGGDTLFEGSDSSQENRKRKKRR